MPQQTLPHRQHRQLIVISGQLEDCVSIAKERIKKLHHLWLSDSAIAGQETLAISKATSVLGQEYDVVVFDAFNDNHHGSAFNANAFGAVTGTIVGGGYLLLLTPNLKLWASSSHFLQRFCTLLSQSSALFYDKEHQPPELSPPLKKPVSEPLFLQEQQDAFTMMQRVIDGHRRRPLVLTSDRGRGKSTLLGEFAAFLLESGMTNIAVTAPSRKIANTLLQSVSSTLARRVHTPHSPDHKIKFLNFSSSENLLTGLQFLSPDELYRQKPKTDVILVDEAASIPLPLLESFIKQHSRVIFATTEHGYEGSGRGFALRFKKLLDNACPQWKSAQLETPYRWGNDDPLENFTFDALLLKTELSEVSSLVIENPKRCDISTIKQKDLMANEALLRELFSLLLSAHYQTRPSDLVRLLDDDNYKIFVMRSETKIVATALVAKEGGFSQELADDIYNGKRRPQGHLIPQTLATHAGVKDAPCYIGERIIRIAVHPELQGKGLGSYLLSELVKASKQSENVDYIATSFGATPELLSFWHRAGFQTVHIGMRRNASSGTHSVVMLKPLSQEADLLYKNAQHNFSASLPLLLADPLRDLESSIITILFEKIFGKNEQALLELTSAENQALSSFCDQLRAYESSISAIYKLTLKRLSQGADLSPYELQLVVGKVLQKKSWQQLVALSNATGKKQVITLLRQAVKKLVGQH